MSVKLRYVGVFLLLSVLFTIVVSSCSTTVGYVGTNIGNRISGSYQLLNGTKTKDINADTGESIELTYSSVVEEGELEIKVQDSGKHTVIELQTGTSGTETILVGQDTPYKVVITGDDTKGSFDISWEIK